MRISLTIVLPFLLAACVSTSATWAQNDMSNRATDNQLLGDMGYCRQAAEAASPIPSAPTSQPSGYDVSGTYRQPGYNSGTFTASVEPRTTLFDTAMGGYNTAGAQIAIDRARTTQENLFRGCMADLGWQRG